MRLHLNFTVYDLKSTLCQLRISFQDANGNPLKDKNQRFYTTGGFVAVFKDMTPAYNPAVYSDFQVFMPYAELDLPTGNYSLKMDADVIYKDGELIEHLTLYEFTYREGAPPAPTTPTTPPKTSNTKFDRIWIDYDITENGQFGMRIHVKFSVYNLKGVSTNLAIFFDRDNVDLRLKSYDGRFQSKNNEVYVYRALKPAYDSTVYEDLDVFIPYSELHLTTGKHNLRIDADLTYANGDLIEHLGFESFSYWKR